LFGLLSKSKSHCDWWSVIIGVGPHLELMTRYLLLSDSYGLVFLGRPLWREDGSVFCICCWSLPAQSFSGPCPLVLETIFYCLRFETSLFVASYDPQVPTFIKFTLKVISSIEYIAGFEILTVVVMKTSIFRNIRSCSSVKVKRYFREMNLLHPQGWRVNQAIIQNRGQYVPLKRRLTFTGLHIIIFQKTDACRVYCASHSENGISTTCRARFNFHHEFQHHNTSRLYT
jgi:hypothetical protein